MVNNSRGRFAYITVGGTDKVLVYRRLSGSAPELFAAVKTGDLPHGIWGAGDGNHVYVGLENGDAVQSIDTSTNQVTAAIPVGQLPQALVYVPNAVVSDRGTANLKPLGSASEALHIELIPPEGGASKAHASISVNSLGLIDNLQIAATGLDAGQMYKLFLVGVQSRQELTAFQAGIGGTAIAQTFGPLKRVVGGSEAETMTLEVRSAHAPAALVLQQSTFIPKTTK